MANAISSYGLSLMHKNLSTWEKFMDIKSVPDLGGAPDQLESTTLSNTMKTYVEGVQDTGAIEIPANYTKENFKKAHDLKGKGAQEWAIYVGVDEEGTPDGHDGVFYFSGPMSVMKSSVDVNAVQEMKMTITLETDIEFSETVKG